MLDLFFAFVCVFFRVGGFSDFWLLWLSMWLFMLHPLHSQFPSVWLLRLFVIMRLVRLWLFASFFEHHGGAAAPPNPNATV